MVHIVCCRRSENLRAGVSGQFDQAYEAPPSTKELFYTEGSEELERARLQVWLIVELIGNEVLWVMAAGIVTHYGCLIDSFL